MRRRISEYGLFLREFFANYHTTGAVLPSSRFLARALVRFVRAESDGPRRILEVGPGTGAVTGRIVAAMREDDRLDLVELNDRFVAQLRERFETDKVFQPVADRARVLHCPVQELPAEDCYDVIISGLPLNNFSAELVEQLLAAMIGLVAPGGTLSFFEYVAIRRMRAVVSSRSDRDRLRAIDRTMHAALDKHEVARDRIWPNVPPAWVHHLRVDGDAK